MANTTFNGLQEEQQEGSTIFLRVILTIAMLVVTFSCGGVPILIKGLLKRSETAYLRWHSLLSCFSGGVFLATTFLDIIPHVIESYADLREKGYFVVEFPLAEFVMCLAFFTVYFLELLIMTACMKGLGHTHNTIAVADVPRPRSFGEMACEEETYVQRKASTFSTHEEVMAEATRYVASEDKTKHSFIKTITFTFAISFHSILEGFALGVQQTQAATLSLFVSLIIHKGVEAFSVGLQVCMGQSKKSHYFFTVAIYALMTPIGIGLGITMRSVDFGAKDPIIAILESMACGTFMYVTFLEILAEEKENGQNQMLQLLATFVGFCLISALQLLFHEE